MPHGLDPEQWAQLRANSGIRDEEKWWVKHQPFLLSKGYALRPRYNPHWTPTWELPGNEELWSHLCEDSLPIRILSPGNVLDAIRVEDNTRVVLKLISSAREMQISWYLGNYLPEMAPDKRNRTVPLLEAIDFKAINFEDEKYMGILVFPLLRAFDDPPFRQLGEVAVAFEQFLEGVEYMHAKNVAHRDLCYGNLMMDATHIIPKGWHFVAPYSHQGIRVGIDSKPRASVQPVSYYVIDFGLSREFFDVLPQDARDVGRYGQDKTVPELSDTVPYNPFKVDIYQLGNVILKLVETYEGLEIFRLLAEDMTVHDPDKRPTASECLNRFHALTISGDVPVRYMASSDSEDSEDSEDSDDSESEIGTDGLPSLSEATSDEQKGDWPQGVGVRKYED